MTTLSCQEVTRDRPIGRPDWHRFATMLPRLLWRLQQRRRDRIDLLTMSDLMLRDIGISRLQADRAARDINLWR